MRPKRTTAAAAVSYAEPTSDEEGMLTTHSADRVSEPSTKRLRSTRAAAQTSQTKEGLTSKKSPPKRLSKSMRVDDSDSEEEDPVETIDLDDGSSDNTAGIDDDAKVKISRGTKENDSKAIPKKKAASSKGSKIQKKKKAHAVQGVSIRASKSLRERKNIENELYAEAESDDEFAKSNLMYGSDEDAPAESSDEESKCTVCSTGEKLEYRAELILGTQAMSAGSWRHICDKMNTREVTRGSVWMQPDEEYLSEAEEPVQKYLIKWSHASYLHVSWETEKDLLEMASKSIKSMLLRFNKKQAPIGMNFDGFDDLRANELIPPSYVSVERILDIEDSTVNILDMPYDTASLNLSSSDDEEAVLLHGSDCFVVVKWEGLPYSDASFESIQDLLSRGIPYEIPLRHFYRREQREPAKVKRANISEDLDVSAVQTDASPSFPGGELRDYQWEGVKWLLFNWTQRRNSILADEMGLGKTIQTACFLQMLRTTFQQRGPFLIIAPLSTVVNWQREIASWTDLDAVLYYGSQEDRKIARDHEFFYSERVKTKGYKVEVVITTPETAMLFDSKSSNRNKRELSAIQWGAVVIDEAHKCKNYDSKFTSMLREEYKYHSCLLLTGTPLQNNIEELWTLLNFVDRKEFASREAFFNKFGDLKSARQLDALHSKVKPYMLRREKEHVEKSVPPKQEILVEVELTSIQKQYYRAIYEQKTSFLFKKEAKDGPSLSNLAMELRKCCLHLFLIKGANVELQEHFKGESAVEIIIKASAKMTLLDKLLPKLKSEGHRVLIFSQFVIMLDIIEDYLDYKQLRYERVDGRITGKDRQKSIDKFANDSEVFVMLLSTKAGGVGINLTQADTVIIFDSDWNPQNDLQAQARAHRIGQLKPVTVYRLLTKNTYEQAMFRAASIKLGLDYAVMHNLHNSNVTMEGIAANKSAENFSSLSRKELENLLKHGAYGAFSTDTESIEEETIEQILSRSSTILHEEKAKESIPSVKSSFAKASFVSAATNDSSNTVSIDDPDFWEKVVGLAVKETDDALSTKRKCRDLVSSYKEPGMAVKGTAYNEESESDSSIGKEKKLKKSRNNVEPAEYSEQNMQKLLHALLSRGYCNWSELTKESKLRWTPLEIARGCRLCIASLLCYSSSDIGGSIYSEKLSSKMSHFKVVRLALTASLAVDNDEVHIIESAFSIEMETQTSSDLLPFLRDKLNIVLEDSKDESESSLSIKLDDILNLRLQYQCFSKDPEQQLQHLEDMLEIKLMCLLDKSYIACTANDMCDDQVTHADEANQCSMPLLASFLRSTYASSAITAPFSWWTSDHDIKLLQAVQFHGSIDSKRKWTSIQSTFSSGETTVPSILPPDYRPIAGHLQTILQLTRGKRPHSSKALPYAASALRALGKVGRPHLLHKNLLGQLNERDLSRMARFTMTWEQLLDECGKHPSLDIPRLQVLAKEVDDIITEPDRIIDKGLLCGLSSKTVEESRLKADALYQIRTLLLSEKESEICSKLFQKVMQTGSSVPLYARDKTMPVWWTTSHDIKLLKLTAMYGLNQWKKILAPESQRITYSENEVDDLSILEAPRDFIIPVKENGADWLLSVSAKSAERRITHILKAVDIFSRRSSLESSPPKSYSYTSQAKLVSKTVKTSKVSSPRATNIFVWDKYGSKTSVPAKCIEKSVAFIETSAESTHLDSSISTSPSSNLAISMNTGKLPSTTTIVSEALELTDTIHAPPNDVNSVNATESTENVGSGTLVNEITYASEGEILSLDASSHSCVSYSVSKQPLSDVSNSNGISLEQKEGLSAPKSAMVSKVESKILTTEIKKVKVANPNATIKKPASSGSILTFFSRKAEPPSNETNSDFLINSSSTCN